MGVILVLLLSAFTSTAFAFTTGYQPYLDQPHFTRIPTVCAVDPNDPSTDQGRQSLIMNTVQTSVSEWSSLLALGSSHPENWNMKYIELSSSQAQSYDYSVCDIVIIVKPVPDSLPFCGVNDDLGCEQYTGEYRLVSIFYNEYQYCTNSPTGSNVCPTGALTTRGFANILEHELGHALGLGHYVSNDPALMDKWNFNRDAPTLDVPSIMIPYIDQHPGGQGITALDVQKVKELYNYQGFIPFTSTGANPFTSLTATVSAQADMVNIAGYIAPLFYASGNQIEILIADQNGNQIFDQKFLTVQQVSQSMDISSWTDGTYDMKVKYGAYESPDVYFVKSENVNQNNPTPQPTPSQTQSSLSYTPTSSIPVDGTNLSVQYDITNGKVLGIKADVQSKSLIVSIQTTGDGAFTVTLPRELIDSKQNGQDSTYQVLSDGGIDTGDWETSTTTTDRTLSIPFTNGVQEIEIVGTLVVPEFGSLAGMIAVISIIGVVIISRRFGFHF